MRRNIGNELLVALLAAVSLLFAALFALLLASSTQNPPLPASPTLAETASATTGVSAPIAPETAAPTLMESETPTAIATVMPQLTRTLTAMPRVTIAITTAPTQVDTEEPSPVAITSATDTERVTVPADLTATSTAMPRETIALSTAPVLVEKETPSPDAVAKATEIIVATVVPDITTTSTAAPTATEAPATLPPVRAHIFSTPTPYRPELEPAEVACQPRQDWLSYEAQPGDTLLALALASDTLLIALREGNCFSPVSGILPGDTLLLPSMPELPLEIPEPIYLPSDTVDQPNPCKSGQARITKPLPGAALGGVLAIEGSAILPDGGSYELALMPAWSDTYHTLLHSQSTVADAQLGLLNSEIFGLGSHWLRLALRDLDGALVPGGQCEIPLTFVAP